MPRRLCRAFTKTHLQSKVASYAIAADRETLISNQKYEDFSSLIEQWRKRRLIRLLSTARKGMSLNDIPR